jgi:hypothetical protein
MWFFHPITSMRRDLGDICQLKNEEGFDEMSL